MPVMAVIGAADHGFGQILTGYYEQMSLATLAMGPRDASLSPMMSPVAPPRDRDQQRERERERERSDDDDDVLGRTEPPQLKQPSSYVDDTLSALLDVHFARLMRLVDHEISSRVQVLIADATQFNNRDVVSGLLDELVLGIIERMRHVFASLAPFMEAFNSGQLFASKMFQHNLIARTRQFFDELAQLFTRYTDHAATTTRPVLLVLCMALGRLKQQMHPLLTQVVFGPVLKLPDEDGQSAALLALLQDISRTLLVSYVRMEGIHLGRIIRVAVETSPWLKRKEPAEVDGWVRTVVQQLLRVRQLVAALLASSGSATTATTAATTTTATPPSSFSDDFDSLFQKKASYFDKVDFQDKSIMTAIVKVALKTLVESVRSVTLERGGFQQMQVNCQYLSLTLQPLVADATQLNIILAEILSSAKDRSLDAIPMDKAVIARICSTAIGDAPPASSASSSQMSAPSNSSSAGPVTGAGSEAKVKPPQQQQQQGQPRPPVAR
jgi:hypothetical protein